MIDETRARALQSAYFISGNANYLWLLLNEIESIARVKIRILKNKTGYRGSTDTVAHDSAMRMLEYYLKYPDWSCHNFSVYIGYQIKHHLYHLKFRRNEGIEIPDDHHEATRIVESTDFVLEELKEDTNNWEMVLLDCYKSTYFKEFILKLATYQSRQWIVDHIVRLKCLYSNLRLPSERSKLRAIREGGKNHVGKN